jgi:hypothetical protein
MWSSNNPKLLLFSILAPLITTAFVNAQNASCQGHRQEFGTVNSTGQHEFTWNSSYASDDPWYVSVLVGIQGPEWNGHDVRANAYISVPGNVSNGTGICSYQYNNINATLKSGGENSCSSVISSVCIDHLTKALSNNVANYCPDSNTGSTSEAFNKACPMLKGGSHSKFLRLSPGHRICPPFPLMLSLFFSHTELILLTGDSGSAAFVHLANKLAQAPNSST